MVPWKVFIRSVGVVTLLATGGFAAGQDVMPFSHVSRSVGEQAVVDDGTTPDVEPAAETPTVDEAALPADGDATTTEVPGTAVPEIVDPADPPDPTVVDDPEKPEAPSTTTPPATAPDADETVTPPAAPVEDDASIVCVAAAETTCGVAEPVPAADSSFDARVQRCQNWWNRLADRLAARNRPQWAERARRVADRCDEMIARWQERQDRQDRRQDRRQDGPEKAKGDHNCDGRPDNGWHKTDGRHPATGEQCTPGAPTPDQTRKGDRPETAPGQVNKAERHSERRR
jgi:hypothetical protein